MSSSIKPTIGRKVWLWQEEDGLGKVLDSKQAFDATIVFVHDTGAVNLLILDHRGNNGYVFDCELRDPSSDDEHGRNVSPYATWMPFQVGQAKANKP